MSQAEPATPGTTLQRLGPAVENELREVIGAQDTPLDRLTAYELGWDDHGPGGEHEPGVRPLAGLCLLGCETMNGDPQACLPAAAAVELGRHFALVHGEVQAGSPERGPRPSTWWVYGPAQAINLGDALHALARRAVFRLEDRGFPVEMVLRAVGMLDQAALRLCEGQHLDLAYQERLEVGEEEFWRMLEARSGALAGCSLGMGALLAGSNETVVGEFDWAGRRLGMAWEVRRQVRELWPGEGRSGAVPSSVLNKSKTLPVIYGLRVAQGRRRRELGSYYAKRMLDADDLDAVARLLEEAGAREYSEGSADALVSEARGLLHSLGVTEPRLAELEEVGELLPG